MGEAVKGDAIRYIKRALIGDPAKNEYERVQAAMRVLSRRIADTEFHRTMANFYTGRVLELDPHTQWWEFAEAKQKQHDHQTDCIFEEGRVAEARELVEARTAQFKAVLAGAV